MYVGGGGKGIRSWRSSAAQQVLSQYRMHEGREQEGKERGLMRPVKRESKYS